MEKINAKDWEIYISRPFNLLGASLWHLLYTSNLCKEILGVKLKNGLLIEYPKGVVRYYRRKDETKKLMKGFDDLALKKTEAELEKIFKEGLLLNKNAEKLLKANKLYNFNEVINFFVRLSFFSTVLPFRGGDVLLANKRSNKISKLIKELRRVSYYPQILEKVVMPMAAKELKKFGVKGKHMANLVTYKEILNKKKINFFNRTLMAREGKFFIYKNLDGRESITWTKNPLALIRKIENIKKENKTIRGNMAFPGTVKGKIKIVLTNKFKNVKFLQGNILVSISTSPSLLPLIKRCGAIITDEGGLTCHAAIISRELKIPCIVGTKIATQVLKNGNLVEVDANNGIVNVLK